MALGLSQYITELTEIDGIKTWSLIMTLFGDFDGAHLSGKQINMLLGHIGIKPEAIRVSLHRLKKDGWIQTNRQGREVFYRLSAKGKRETDAVYDDVYRTDVKFAHGWQMRLVSNEEEMRLAHPSGLWLFRNVCLVPNGQVCSEQYSVAIELTDDNPPEWLLAKLVPGDVGRIASRVAELAEQMIDLHASATPFEVASTRLLLLHRWRRMALRHETWAHISMSPEGPLAKCHSKVTRGLKRLPKIDNTLFAG